MEYKANKHIHPTVIQAEGNMFRRICNPPKFTIRICNPLKPHIYKMMYVGKRIANPHLETAGLQIRRNKEWGQIFMKNNLYVELTLKISICFILRDLIW